MKVIINKFIPFKGYVAITIWPLIFVRKELNKYTLNHEHIHGEQQKELLIIPFYILYVLEYLIKLCITFSTSKAYNSMSFEQEANRYEHELDYIKHRTHYIWIKHIFKVWR